MNSKLIKLANRFLAVLADADGYVIPSKPMMPKTPGAMAVERETDRAEEEYLRRHPTPSTDPADAEKEKEIAFYHKREQHKEHPDAERSYQDKAINQKLLWNVSKQKWMPLTNGFAWNRAPLNAIIQVTENGKTSFYRKTGPANWTWMNPDTVPQESF